MVVSRGNIRAEYKIERELIILLNDLYLLYSYNANICWIYKYYQKITSDKILYYPLSISLVRTIAPETRGELQDTGSQVNTKGTDVGGEKDEGIYNIIYYF